MKQAPANHRVLLMDYYALTMAQSHFSQGRQHEIAYFDYFFRTVPDHGGYAIFAGLTQVLDYLEFLHFTPDDIAFLRSKGVFTAEFLDYLANFRFHGDIRAVPEGSVVFPHEPLLTLLAGLSAPTEGSVQISDGAGADHAFDLATLSEKTKCALISYVPQEPHIFSATLAENVTLWQDNRSPEDAAAALEGAALGDFLRALPQGLDTLLGAGGHPLSAGQRHRLGIARALCAARPVVLLDEPTAGLDAETEERVLRTLTAFAHRRTLIVSSHRPAVMAWADHTITLGGET